MKKEQLFTKGSVLKSIFILGLPLILSQVINVLYNIVDRIFIGNMPVVGKEALAGVGIAFPIIIILSAFAALFGMGGAPQAAIKLGEDKKEDAQEIMMNSFLLLIGIGVVLTVLLLIFSEKLLYLFGATIDIIEYSTSYLNVYAFGTTFVMISMGLSFFISAQGHTKTAALIVLTGAILNIILDPILIFVFDMGVKGAAIATVFSQGVSALLVILFLTSKRSSLRLNLRKLKLNKKVVFKIISLGISPFVMQSTEALIQIFFNNQIVKYGGADYIAYLNLMTIMLALVLFMVLPVQGLTQGASPMISYNYGQGNIKRVKETYKALILIAVIYTAVFYTIILLFPRTLASAFNQDPLVLEKAPKVMRLFFFGLAFIGIQTACQMTFMALNQSMLSIFLAVFRKVIMLIPLLFVLPLFWGVTGIFYAEMISDLAAVTLTLTVFILTINKILNKKAGIVLESEIITN